MATFSRPTRYRRRSQMYYRTRLCAHRPSSPSRDRAHIRRPRRVGKPPREDDLALCVRGKVDGARRDDADESRAEAFEERAWAFLCVDVTGTRQSGLFSEVRSGRPEGIASHRMMYPVSTKLYNKPRAPVGRAFTAAVAALRMEPAEVDADAAAGRVFRVREDEAREGVESLNRSDWRRVCVGGRRG